NAYIDALNTVDPAKRAAAFEAFLQSFPQSVMKPEALELATAARIQVDNERTAQLVRQIPRTPVLAASTPVPTAQERVCKHARERDGDALSVQEMELILGYRGSDVACKGIAQQIWQLIQNRQRSPRGEPSKMRLIVKVLSATPGTIDAALTDENQKAN